MTALISITPLTGLSGLLAENIAAIDVTRARFMADAGRGARVVTLTSHISAATLHFVTWCSVIRGPPTTRGVNVMREELQVKG